MTDLPIIVGVNGTEGSNLAVRAALREARSRACELRLIAAYGSDNYPETELSLLRAARHDAEHHLRRARQITTRLAPSLPISAETAAGDVISVLERESKSSSLLVLGSRHLHRIGSVVRASVGTQLSARTAVPTMVILGPGSDQVGAPVIAGIDGSLAGEAVLRYAVATAQRQRRPLVLISCLDSAEPTPGDSRAQPALAEWIDRINADAASIPATTIEIELAEPVESLGARSHSAAVIIVGRVGLGHQAREQDAGLGRVSSRLLHRARCPVVVVPPS